MMLKTKASGRRSKKNNDEEFLDACEIEEEGFIDGDVKLENVLSTFSFGMSAAADAAMDSCNETSNSEHSFQPKVSETTVQAKVNEPAVQAKCNESSILAKGNTTSLHAQDNALFSSQTESFSAAAHGLTPPINGESFTVKRSYAMRPSTVRKLNALKTEHPDVNVLLNTLVDMALNHYYNYIFNEKGSFHEVVENKATS